MHSLYIRSRLYILLTALLLTSCDSSDPNPTPTTISEVIETYLDETQLDHEAGLSVLVRKDGQRVFQGSRGVAHLEGRAPLSDRTAFRLASVTKPFTALAIMRLVERETLELDEAITDYLPELPAHFSSITIAHLLSHRSGLHDYIDDNTDFSSLDGMTPAELLEVLPTSGLEDLQFAPGTQGDYSNTGYFLLALIVERASGQSFPEFMDSAFFTPLGMADSYIIHEGRLMGARGEEHALAFGATTRVRGIESLIYGPSGQVGSTRDLDLFISALIRGDIVSQQTLDLMTQSMGPLPEVADYGYGWMTGTGSYWHTGLYSSPNDFFHTGGFDGYRTVLSINPDLDLQVVILSNNGEKSQGQMFEILRRVRAFYL